MVNAGFFSFSVASLASSRSSPTRLRLFAASPPRIFNE